jgi:hypothetical protein
MAELKIQESLWDDFVAVAERQRVGPHELAAQVLRDYIQRVSDEELLARSEGAARRSGIRAADAEEIVRRHRRRMVA